jgi:hypothetical protein
MSAATPDAQAILDIGLAPFTVLGAGITFWTGLLGLLSMLTGGNQDAVGAAVDRGTAIGFFVAGPFALYAFVVALTSV